MYILVKPVQEYFKIQYDILSYENDEIYLMQFHIQETLNVDSKKVLSQITCIYLGFWPWHLTWFHLALAFLAGDGRAHMTADEMDEQRKQNVAYEYLCHLEEAKVFVL